MATNLSLPHALNRIRLYQERYRREASRGGLVVEFRLLSVSTIETLDVETLHQFDITFIEEIEI